MEWSWVVGIQAHFGHINIQILNDISRSLAVEGRHAGAARLSCHDLDDGLIVCVCAGGLAGEELDIPVTELVGDSLNVAMVHGDEFDRPRDPLVDDAAGTFCWT
jgi:hypothetical protein